MLAGMAFDLVHDRSLHLLLQIQIILFLTVCACSYYYIVCNCGCFTCANACSRSFTKSSASSSPTERRIRLSLTPLALLFSAGMDLCVILAGWEIRLLILPRLSARRNNLVAVTNCRAAASVSFFSVKETTPPNPFACFLAMS